MELKDYQNKVISDLTEYLAILSDSQDLRTSFTGYWKQKGIAAEPYKNNVPGVPHVCAKVPTAGGKTYIAVNALKSIFDALATKHPTRPQVVVWLVPTLTILDQTIQNLTDPHHPYRQRLNLLFRNRVAIYERADLLMGAGFSADTVKEQLSIVVMSFDSLRAKNKEARKIYQDNGYLASFLSDGHDADWLLPDHDASSLINVIRGLKPVVVVDESHNAETDLSVEMLVNLNPHFIFDLTATPRKNSNIISYVDAMALKKQHMVKLPVIVANRGSRTDVIESAVILRRQLEQLALEQEKAGGKYIRPIVLFQAQPRTGEDKTTFEKVREQLVKAGIPEDQIKIKTAELNELKGLDLMSRDCSVRYIITINALKEGWDCPFAYILASLADKSSAVDVEQILGRVLRMPHVQQHGHDLLNLSYVFTASNRFSDTLQSVVKALNRSGFSNKDYRSADILNATPSLAPAPSTSDIFELHQPSIDSEQSPSISTTSSEGQPPSNELDEDWPEVPLVVANAPETTSIAPSASNATVAFVEILKEQATIENKEFEAKAAVASDVPVELEEKVNRHKLKEIFKEDALSLQIPQFFVEVANSGWFSEKDEMQLLERDELLQDFRLDTADATISFEDVVAEVYRVDLEQSGEGDYAPKPFKVDAAGRQKFNDLIVSLSRESQIRDVAARLAGLIGNMWPITDPELRKYVSRIIESFTPEQIRDCLDRDVAYARKIKVKIEQLATAHAQTVFCDMLDLDKIKVLPSFTMPEFIIPSANAPSLPKSLYTTEASIGQFEARVIEAVANLESVQWWHRNLSRGKGFRINGFINHYPDFVIKLKSGKIIILETKGDDRDNSDSAAKLKLGKLWEAKVSQGGYRYMMLFEKSAIEGSETLANALKKIGQL